MNDFKPYAIFAQTVASGSMSAAARRLGISASAVSQTIRALENQAGVILMNRSTRKLTLTEAGERCYPHCLRLLEAASAAADSLVVARDAPVGELRIAAPVGFAAHLAPALAPVLKQAPQLRLRLLVDDAMIDLIETRIDIAIRVGKMADSNWIARPLTGLDVVMCAAPQYLERHGLPHTPDDLARHTWLASVQEVNNAQGADPQTEQAPQLALELRTVTGEVEVVRVNVRVTSNNQPALQQLCEQGMGIARLAYADILPALTRGALVRIMPQWHFAQLPVTVVTSRRDGEPAKVRLAVKALQRYFAGLPSVKSFADSGVG
ncbi:LysR family transcriptional regulator [Pseudomonas antarctica]|uniref:LysR family transcriptional regulator n=1 Tax=Pseudomonas antarctica TaxID=219572 RepID=UPI003F750D25